MIADQFFTPLLDDSRVSVQPAKSQSEYTVTSSLISITGDLSPLLFTCQIHDYPFQLTPKHRV